MKKTTTKANTATVAMLAILAAVLPGNGCVPMCDENNQPPGISFTHVPPFGSFDDLRGVVSGVSPTAHRVVVYIQVGGTWWVKPTAVRPLTRVGLGCQWEVDITTGGLDQEAVAIRAFVVRAGFNAAVNTLPADTDVLASVTTVRRPSITIGDAGRIGSPTVLRGVVGEMEPTGYRIAAYILVGGTWWIKPSAMAPFTPIANDGTWIVDIATADTDIEATRAWVGLVRKDVAIDTNSLPEGFDLLASDCVARRLTESDAVLPCAVDDMFTFAEEQFADAGNDAVAGGLPAAFATEDTTGLPTEFLEWASDRAIVYDVATMLTAMAKLTPDRREPFIRQAADAFVFAIDNDSAGDGRIRDAYFSSDIRAPEPNRDRPSILNGETHVGNAAWAVLALCNAYRATKDARYLSAAEDLGNWINSHMRAEDELGGYYGGLLFPPEAPSFDDANLKRVGWRSVEHNTDLVVAFQSLANLTLDAVWRERAEHARRFVEAPSLHNCEGGFWHLGTTTATDINFAPLAEDTATWPWLAGIRPCGEAPLSWTLSELRTVTNGFDGIRFSDAGEGVVSESTAHLALALRLAGMDASAAQLIKALEDIRAEAPNADGLGLVATPAPENGIASGMGERHYAAPNLAATAWAIFAQMETNPFEPVSAFRSANEEDQ